MFSFRGKSGQEHVVRLSDQRLARIIKACQELPGYNLFEYEDREGNICSIDSSDVNLYIREAAGQDFTAKDFRTWAGTRLAARELCAAGPPRNPATARKIVVEAVKRVARHLGNRPAASRKYYIGFLFPAMQSGEQQDAAYSGLGLSPDEYAVMVVVARYQEKLAKEIRQKAA